MLSQLLACRSTGFASSIFTFGTALSGFKQKTLHLAREQRVVYTVLTPAFKSIQQCNFIINMDSI